MKATRAAAFSWVLGVSGLGLGLGLGPWSGPAGARSAFAAPPHGDPGAPNTPSLGTLLEEYRFGTTHVDITKMHNRVNGVFDRDYNPILAKMQPGTRMQAVEFERETKKQAFASSFIEFKDTPLGYDTTGLKGEYSYKNHEAIQVEEREGRRRFFFYIGAAPGDRFWKLYDEVRLQENGAYGQTYAEAVQKMQTTLGVVGRARNADPDKGFRQPYTEWQSGTEHLRVIDRSNERLVGIAIEDKATLANLAQLRPNKLDDPMAMDPSITAITRAGVSDPTSNGSPPAGNGKTSPKDKKK